MIVDAVPERTINKLSYYRVKLQSEWMGNPEGSELTLMEPIAQTLLNRGTARLVKVAEKEPKGKSLESPPKDKMMKKTKVRTKSVTN